jgi:Protein of unknown function (DUF2851)
MQEAELYNYWQYYARAAKTIHWNKNKLKILQTGQLNEHQGPDFQYARFELNGITYQGAVEFHLELDDWYRHKHHYDPAYQDVVLHVVAKAPKNNKQVRHHISGRDIPTFMLGKPVIPASRLVCKPANLNNAETIKRLQKLALDRLNFKVQSFTKSLKSHSEHALFYRSFFRILGYPNNKHIFELLSQKVPQQIYEDYKDRPNLLMALYFGSSGFLQESFKDQFAVKLQKLYYHYAAILSLSSLDKKQWQMSANRPLNHPQLRIAAWVTLLLSLNNQAPFNMLNGLLQKRLNYQELFDKLHKIFALKTQGYWQRHYALERQAKNKTIQLFFGHNRINEIISNLVIPLCMAKAKKNNNLGFISFLQEFYLWMPGSCSYGSLFRKSPWLKDYINIWQSCNSGQALLHLNEIYCSGNLCLRCPLERKLQ